MRSVDLQSGEIDDGRTAGRAFLHWSRERTPIHADFFAQITAGGSIRAKSGIFRHFRGVIFAGRATHIAHTERFGGQRQSQLARATLNNAEFVEGLRKQDPAAAKHLNECFVPSIWRFVYFRVDRDSHVAEDIVGEAVLALVAAATSGSEIEHPSAWLRTVALRRIQDHFRAAARVQHLIEQVQQNTAHADEQDPATQHDRKLKCQTVREAMDRLPESYRMALEWKYVERLSVRVIAERLESSEKSVESILFRARKALRTQLGGQQCDQRRSTAERQANADQPPESSMQRQATLLPTPRLARET